MPDHVLRCHYVVTHVENKTQGFAYASVSQTPPGDLVKMQVQMQEVVDASWNSPRVAKATGP